MSKDLVERLRAPCMSEFTYDADKEEAANRINALEEALEWVLPMAKGFAASHRVGNNAEIAEHASAILSGSDYPLATTDEPVEGEWWYDRIAALEADNAKAVDVLLTVKDYVDDSAAGLLQYRGRSTLVEMATEDKARIDAVLSAIRAAR